MSSRAGDYQEAGFLSSSSRLIQKTWFTNKVRNITPASILNQARILRDQYDSELVELLDQLSNAKGFSAKRILPKVRYRIGRLAYLATPDRLTALADIVSAIPTLYFQSEVARAIGTGNIDNIIALGTNAAQAVAQPMRMSSQKVKLSRAPKNDAEMQSLAIIALNGVSIDVPSYDRINHELFEFAKHGASEKLMRSSDIFIRELACLHGVSKTPRHTDVFDSAFDEAEDFALDAIDQTRSSLSL
jgi:deoxyhypusine synthase